MTQEMNELTELLNRRLAVASEILNERLEKPPYVNIEGVSKLKNRLASEIRFLDGVKAGKQPMEKKFIETSNVTHFENIVKKVEEYEDVVALLRSFTIKNTDDDGDRNHFKHTVDFVAKNGNQWVKVISRSAKGICMDWLTCSTRNIFEQASDYIDMAQRFQRNFMPPEVVFDFISGVPDKIADKLRSKGVTVVGESIDINTLTKVPEDFLEMLEVSSDEEAEPEQPETKSLPPINLDVSAVFVLISNMTHENGTNHKFGSSLLKQQAGMEKTHKAKVELLRQIEGRDWIMCKTAFEAVHSIVGTVGGPSERLRCQQLLEKVRVVDDFLSERSQKLTLSDRVNERSRVIFGSGDHYKAVTATANKHFVSSAYHQENTHTMATFPKVLAKTIDCKQGAVRAVRYNVDGNYCVTCGSDKTVKLWNPVRGSLLKTYSGTGNEVFDAASSSDNAQIAAGGADRALTIFDVESGKQLRRWRAHGAQVNAVAFNEESNVVFSGSMDCTMQAFDARSRSEKAIQIFTEATDGILSIDVNGHEIVVGSADNNYRTYSIRDGNMTVDFMGDSVNSVHFTPDGNCILAGVMGGALRLMDKGNGRLLASYKGHQNKDYKLDACVLSSIEYVASGSEDGFVYIYSLLESTIVAQLEHPSKVIPSLSAHPKLNQLATAAGQILYLWTPAGDATESSAA